MRRRGVSGKVVLWFRCITRVTLPAASGTAGSFVSRLRWIALSRAYRWSASSFCRLEIFSPYSFDNSFRLVLFYLHCLGFSLSFSGISWSFDFIRTANDSAVSVASYTLSSFILQRISGRDAVRFSYLGNVTGVFANEMQIPWGKRYRSVNRKINVLPLKFAIAQIKRNLRIYSNIVKQK